jgi:hypothetical protein
MTKSSEVSNEANEVGVYWGVLGVTSLKVLFSELFNDVRAR